MKDTLCLERYMRVYYFPKGVLVSCFVSIGGD